MKKMYNNRLLGKAGLILALAILIYAGYFFMGLTYKAYRHVSVPIQDAIIQTPTLIPYGQ